jgi:endoribonuclease Dicer
VSSSGRPGTTKRRQYYTKQVADSLTEKPASGNEETGDRKREIYCLYAFQMRLTCALPDEQNTRGRKIHPPENAELSFGILVQVNFPLFEII